jgi:radical SAM superfamily enzyme YgiQ (UPF0313 family)
MKIGLIFPNKDRKDKTVHLGLGYIAAYARKQYPDLVFELLDTRVATKKETARFFEGHFDLIGITVLSPVYHEVIRLVRQLKDELPHVPLCLGGPYVTTIMEEIFEETPVDYAVYGEGELSFSALIGYLRGEAELHDIQGLMYKKGSQIITNPPRPQIQNLDEIPYPAYELFKMNRYPMHRIVSSRGCPYTCVFCNSSSIWLGKWRKRSPQAIADEIEFLVHTYGRKTFFFNDNSFNVDLKRVRAFCNALLERKSKILWTTPVRAEIIDPETAQLMKRAGCYNVGIGIESANNAQLVRMQKRNTIEAVQKGIRIFKDAGIEVLGQFVIGSPGDTLGSVHQSIAFAKQSELDFVMFYAILPFKTTEQWDYVQKEGRLYHDKIHDFHEIHPRIVFDTPEFSYEDRLQAIAEAKAEGFYSETNDRQKLFDIGKDLAGFFQQTLPAGISSRLYLMMKWVYRKLIWKNK